MKQLRLTADDRQLIIDALEDQRTEAAEQLQKRLANETNVGFDDMRDQVYRIDRMDSVRQKLVSSLNDSTPKQQKEAANG